MRKLVQALKNGWIKLPEEQEEENKKKREEKKQFYLMWDDSTSEKTKQRVILPPPKMKLPGFSLFLELNDLVVNLQVKDTQSLIDHQRNTC